MLQTISKSTFKPRVLEYLRLVEETKKPLIITHAGKATIRIEPYSSKPRVLASTLLGSVLSYSDPTQPVGLKDWEVLG